MANFSEIEQQLLKSITNDRLITSLALIRQASEDIWADDAPRIIRDYTDHGIAHIKRLASYASKLIKANDGRPLSSQEMYLLLAGIYLHDIGMQCDVIKFPEIRTLAEKLGADFGQEFTTQKASEYGLDEQKGIRKNHQYLSAAWIDYGYRTGQTVLGQAAESIPEDLVDDLMDICKHHTKLPIANCPLAFRFYPNERKQLVAALLRFSDELDIEGSRVSIETVKNFAIDPSNSLYWWLHNRTNISFIASNAILMTIRLNPKDVQSFGPLVYSAFITEFQTKNQPVLSVLGQNGIPIVISSDSKVLEHDRAKSLPNEIVRALQIMRERSDPLIELANEIRTWLQAIRYEVSDIKKRSNRVVDMIATIDQGPFRQSVLVRCIDGEISSEDVMDLDNTLDRKTPQGWLISDKRVSDLARDQAGASDSIKVFNLSDFLRQLVWRPYIDSLTALVEKDQIPVFYVDLACYRQEMEDQGKEIRRDRHPSLDIYIDNWLKERGKMHISLLGEFGAGKTWFCRHYAYRQLERYLADPANERLPLLITLRTFAKAITPQQLINDALLEQYKLPFIGSAYEVFLEMNRRGKLLLILDGFDEMARQVDYQTVVDNFWQLSSLVDEGSKVILTSRTEYFRWAKESEKILGGEEYGRRTIVLSPPKFEVLYLEPFGNDQIRDVIIRRLGPQSGPKVAERILRTTNLAEMGRKPLLVELLLAALDEVSGDILENPAQVYLYATNKLLLRNIDTRRTFTSTADKLYFLCELAWEMIKSGELRIHFTDIPDRIKLYFGDRIKDQRELDTWDFDLRNQTLLHRDAAGYYEFAHKSLVEYFVSLKFGAELGLLAAMFLQTYCESDERPCKFPIDIKEANYLTDTFGAVSLTDERMEAIHDFLLGMMNDSAPQRLWEIVNETKHKSPEQVRFAGGNAATLLCELGASFIRADLRHVVLTGARLFNLDLTGATFQSASLNQVVFRNCGLENVDMTGADLNGTRFVEELIAFSIAFSPNGKYIAAAGTFGFISVWNLKSGQEKFRLFGCRGNVLALSWSDDGLYLSAIDNKMILVWRIPSSEPISRYAFEEAENFSIMFANPRTPEKTYIYFVAKYGALSFDRARFDVQANRGSEYKNKLKEFLPIQEEEIDPVISGYFDSLDDANPPREYAIDDKHSVFASKQLNLIVGVSGKETQTSLLTISDKIYNLQLPFSETIVTSINYCSAASLFATSNFFARSGQFCVFGLSDGGSMENVKNYEIKLDYKGMNISGATGLEIRSPSKSTGKSISELPVLKYLSDRGVILDDDQKKYVMKL